MKNMKKIIALVIAVIMALGMLACDEAAEIVAETVAEVASTATETKTETATAAETTEAADDGKDILANDYHTAQEFDLDAYVEESGRIAQLTLGDYYAALETAYAEVENVDLRYALEAIAEAKLMEAAVYLPYTSQGGNYAISRIAGNTVPNTLWGLASERYEDAVIASDFITAADRAEMKAQYKELKGTGEYLAWAKQYLTDKGYTLIDTFAQTYSSDPTTWNIFATYRAADSEAIENCFDFLVRYDVENVMQPALAESWTVSEDGLTYTFKIRENAVWTDSQGNVICGVTADDFVAGMQHMLDCQGGTEYLVDGVILNASEYLYGEITDFTQVGVKALDDYTLEYTLCEPTSYFLTMLTYNPFAPLCRKYYESQGGKFGADFNAEDTGYKYGLTPDNIAYCGPYVVTNATAENMIVFEANPNYYRADEINIKKITWYFNDGSDATKAYKDAIAGTLSGCGLNTEALALCKEEGMFDDYAYVSATDATSYGTFYNLNRTGFSNFNDGTVGISTSTLYDANRAKSAMLNVHFRRAISFGVDRAMVNGQSVGEDLKYNCVINSYTPGTFVSLTKDVTVDINGTATTFAAGTYYGEIMQAQIDADGVKIQVWDPNGDGGIGSSAGFDGWFNVENAVEELNIAIEELAAEGIVIDEKNPIYLDLPYPGVSTTYTNKENAYAQSVNTNLGGKVIIRTVDVDSFVNWYYSGYYADYGYYDNYDLYDCSGWGPDYGDPCTYLNTLLTDFAGDMTNCLGIY